MKPRTVLYIVFLVLLGVFALANWSTVTRPIQLDLLVREVVVPLGIPLLCILAAIFVFDALMHAMSRREWARERRKLTAGAEHDTSIHSELLPHLNAEQERLQAVQETLERETAAIRTQLERLTAELVGIRNTQTAQPGATRPDLIEQRPLERLDH